jgi:beta-phosphoglucomutase family hydrolase
VDHPAVKLPDGITACLFDMDGVLTRTAEVHAAAWKDMFDAFLRRHAERTGGPYVPFDPVADYDEHVDGLPRLDGTRQFLRSRGIDLPEGTADDPPGTETVYGLSNLKNDLVLARIREQGVRPYEGSVRFVEVVRRAGLRTAVVSSSVNTHAVLEAAGLTRLMDAAVDGTVAASERLAGKPAPDTYLAAARRLDVEPRHAAVFEDALAGVAAGHAGHFGVVVGVDRVGQADALRVHGADVVVTDLADLIG